MNRFPARLSAFMGDSRNCSQPVYQLILRMIRTRLSVFYPADRKRGVGACIGSVLLYTLPGNDMMGVNEDTYPVVPKTVPKCVGFGTDVNAGTV